MRSFRTLSIAAATACALSLSTTPVFAADTPASDSSTATTAPGSGTSKNTAPADTTDTNNKDSAGSKDHAGSGTKPAEKDDDSNPDEDKDKNKFSSFNDKGALERLGSMTSDHLNLVSAIIGVLGSAVTVFLAVVKYIPGMRDVVRSMLAQMGVRFK